MGRKGLDDCAGLAGTVAVAGQDPPHDDDIDAGSDIRCRLPVAGEAPAGANTEGRPVTECFERAAVVIRAVPPARPEVIATRR